MRLQQNKMKEFRFWTNFAFKNRKRLLYISKENLRKRKVLITHVDFNLGHWCVLTAVLHIFIPSKDENLKVVIGGKGFPGGGKK